MELKETINAFLTQILEEFSYHPLIAPYLNTSRDNPPQHYLHQNEVLAKLVFRRPIRVLIGDEIGLGKTVTALTIAKFLERIGRASKILILVPRVLVGQWRKELIRMGIVESKIRHLERDTISFWRGQGFPSGYYIASIDLLKKRERMVEVADVPWDLVIVDEAHKLGFKTKRFWVLGKKMVEARPSRDALFLSATPHRGDPKDYISRLQLLDPYLVKGWRELDRRTFYGLTHGSLLFRRTKEDVNKVYECRKVFPPAKFYAGVIKARRDEAEFVDRLVKFLRSKLVEFAYEKGFISEKVIPLLTVLVFKRASSSPYAALTTLQRMLVKRVAPELTKDLIENVKSYLDVGYEDYEYPDRDPEEVFNEFLEATSSLLTPEDGIEIEKLRDMAKAIMEAGDSKLNALISMLEDVMAEEGSKVIIFTEYKDTLDYIIENLKHRHPEWAGSLLRLCSEEVRDARAFERIRKAFEDPKSKARILVATDVVSEGVNLQVAHILINYEIPWSLIKLEQRIGRVWRLGQRRDVEAYTLFMDNVADRAALYAMYSKLLNLKRAGLSPRPVTGQDVLLYAEAEDLMRIPPSIAFKVERGKKKFFRVTEAKSILTYLRDGSTGLENLMTSIIAARYEIEKELASKGVLYKPKNRDEIEEAIGLLGFRNPNELLGSMMDLVKSSSTVLGFKVYTAEEGVKVVKGFEMPLMLKTLDDIYGYLARGEKVGNPIGLVAYGDGGRKVILIPIQLRDRRDGAVLYRELLGVDVEDGMILRGPKLLSVVSQALSNCLGALDLKKEDLEIPITLMSKVVESIRRSASKLLEPVNLYLNKLFRENLRDMDRTWIRISDLESEPLTPIGYIQFVERPKTPIAVPEEVKKRVEEAAVKLVMEVERREGRVPTIVPEEEHYDIRSIDPITKEIRIIEVKGHKGPEVYGELTEEEAKLAERERERYYLYIVYDIGSEKPKYLRFRDPLQTMNWRIFEKIERKRRYLLWPKMS